MNYRDAQGRFLKGHPVPPGWGFKKGHRPLTLFWTEEKKELLRRLYPIKTNIELSEVFGRTPKAISNMGSLLGLKKNPETYRRAIRHVLSKESRKKLSKSLKKYYETHDGTWEGKKFSKSHRENISRGGKGTKLGDANPSKRPEVRRKIAQTLRNGASSFHHFKEHPEWRRKSLEALMKKPTKPEKRLISIIEQNILPFEYVGNGKVIIGTLNPDFIHNDGEKKVIEVFGRTFHDPEVSFKDEIPWHQQYWGRMAYLAQLGYDCLILWADELDDEIEVVKKVEVFLND